MKRFLCSKCNGSGRIEGFNHIDGGRCFQCDGSGRHRHTAECEKQIGQLSADVRRKADFVLNVTPETVGRMGYEKLEKMRDFCHRCLPGYPSLKAIWDDVAESIFQKRQEKQYQEWKANGGW